MRIVLKSRKPTFSGFGQDGSSGATISAIGPDYSELTPDDLTSAGSPTGTTEDLPGDPGLGPAIPPTGTLPDTGGAPAPQPAASSSLSWASIGPYVAPLGISIAGAVISHFVLRGADSKQAPKRGRRKK